VRRTVARRLHKQAREIHLRPGRQAENKLMAVRVTRGAARLAKLRWERFRQVKALIGRGTTAGIADILVPQVSLTALIAVCTGPRKTYKLLKQLYHDKKRRTA